MPPFFAFQSIKSSLTLVFVFEGGETASPVPKTFRAETVGEDNAKTMEFRPIHKPGDSASQEEESGGFEMGNGQGATAGSKNSRRKRRRKSLLKKKQQQTKKNSPSNQEDEEDNDTGNQSHSSSVTPPPTQTSDIVMDHGEEIQFELEDVNVGAEKR